MDDKKNIHTVKLASRLAKFTWSCLCRPEQGHDHESTIAVLLDRMKTADAVIESYNKRSCPVRRLGIMKYQIINSRVELVSPYVFALSVLWQEWRLGSGTRVVKLFEDEDSNALNLPTPEEVDKIIQERVEVEGNRQARLLRRGVV